MKHTNKHKIQAVKQPYGVYLTIVYICISGRCEQHEDDVRKHQ